MFKMWQMKKRRNSNSGSAIIEITLLIPVFLGCIYLYIMLFLFLIDSTKEMSNLAENLYTTQDSKEENDKSVNKKGKTKSISVDKTGKLFHLQLEMKKNDSDAIENIRRWQLVTGGI